MLRLYAIWSFFILLQRGDSNVLIPVIKSSTYKIKNHSIPSWYVVSLLWWYAKRRYSNAPYRGIQKSWWTERQVYGLAWKDCQKCKNQLHKKLKRQPSTLYLEEIPESALPAQNLVADVYTKSEFEEKRLAEVFSRLSLMRNRILTRNFIHKTVHDTYYIFTMAYWSMKR